jgi:hypothetical protein
MLDRRQFHKRVRSGAASQASGPGRHPAGGQCRLYTFGHRGPGRILTGFHRMRYGGESAADQVTRPCAKRAAVSLQRCRDRIRHLDRYVSINRRYHNRGRGTWRCTDDSIDEIAELLLCFP